MRAEDRAFRAARDRHAGPDSALVYIQWPAITQYYHSTEITPSRRAAWTASAVKWGASVQRAIAADTAREALSALEEATKVELRFYFDDHLTQKVARLLCLKEI